MTATASRPAHVRGLRTGRLPSGRSSLTAEFAALFRAGAMNYPEDVRGVTDPYAKHFVGSRYLRSFMRSRVLMRRAGEISNRYYRGSVGQVVMRARYADDALIAAAARGLDQVVMLGSGYDATSVRLSEEGLAFFEVDHPETQARKRAVLTEHAPADALERIVFVPCDFNAERPGERLLAHGFDRSRPAFVNWLAVSWYIPRESVEATLQEIESVTAPGSQLVFDHPHRSSADRGARRARRRTARVGEPWLFGIDPADVPGWLAQFGFEVVEQLTGSELDDRYYPDGSQVPAANYIGHVLAERT